MKYACEGFADRSFFDRIDLIADNDSEKRVFTFEGLEKPVTSIENCLEMAEKEPLILITVVYCLDVLEQLNNIPDLNHCFFSIYLLAQDFVEPYQLPANRAESEPLKIPKTIHYCWFGGSPIRDDFKEYIETWKKFCPDYEIVRWDESNYDYKKNEYMYEAYKHKKWGFVSDYARLDIIYSCGGVYFDTDVELIRNIDDLLCDAAFYGFAYRGIVANGLGFGAVAGFPLILEQMKIYDKISFLNEDDSLNLKLGPYYQTELMNSKGLVTNNTLQKINGMTVYPSDVLSPLSAMTGILTITDNTYAIHHYAGTWFDNVSHGKRNMLLEKFKFLAEEIEERFPQ